MPGSFAMARRPHRDEAEILSEKDLNELRHNPAHLSIQAVRDFYDQAYRDCRLIYHRLPSPKQIQTLVQVWKQLWKWRGSKFACEATVQQFNRPKRSASFS